MSATEIKESIKRLLEQIERSTKQRNLDDARRTSWRYMWAAAGTVELIDSKDSAKPLYITTHCISAESLDFHSPRTLERGCKVLINLETDEGQLQIPATVVHCTPSVGKPLVGVNFDLDK